MRISQKIFIFGILYTCACIYLVFINNPLIYHAFLEIIFGIYCFVNCIFLSPSVFRLNS